MTKKIPYQWKNGRLIPVMDTDLADFPGEEWKDMFVPGFDNVYKVSNHGRFKSIARIVETKNGKRLPKAEKIIKLNIRQYKKAIIISVGLFHEELKTKYAFSVSRMVYYLFVEPFDWENRSMAVGRIDGDTLNCFYKNLKLEPAGKLQQQPINQYDKDGLFLKRFDSIQEAALETDSTLSQIREAMLNKGLQGKRYYWRRDPQVSKLDLSGFALIKEISVKKKFRRVQRFTLDGEPKEVYESLLEAASSVGKEHTGGIIKACGNFNLTAYGYRWRYIDKAESNESEPVISQNGTKVYKDKVHQYGINGVYIATYNSVSAAAKALGFDSTRISSAISAKNITAYEYYWRKGKVEEILDISAFGQQRKNKFNAEQKKVQKLKKDGTLVATYDSIAIAANAHGVRGSLIAKACNNPTSLCLGFRWRFVED